MKRPDLIKAIIKEGKLTKLKRPKTSHYLTKRQLEQLLIILRVKNTDKKS